MVSGLTFDPLTNTRYRAVHTFTGLMKQDVIKKENIFTHHRMDVMDVIDCRGRVESAG